MLKRSLALVLAVSILLISCSSTTQITSNPPGAKVFLNDEYIGKTPLMYEDSKIIFSTNHLKIEKEGYKTLYTSFSRDEAPEFGAIVAGFIVWAPFLWAMKYKPNHTYELEMVGSGL